MASYLPKFVAFHISTFPGMPTMLWLQPSWAFHWCWKCNLRPQLSTESWLQNWFPGPLSCERLSSPSAWRRGCLTWIRAVCSTCWISVNIQHCNRKTKIRFFHIYVLRYMAEQIHVLPDSENVGLSHLPCFRCWGWFQILIIRRKKELVDHFSLSIGPRSVTEVGSLTTFDVHTPFGNGHAWWFIRILGRKISYTY